MDDVTNSNAAPAEPTVIPDSPEYNAKMAAAGEGVTVTHYDNNVYRSTDNTPAPVVTESTTDRPAWLPEKFKTAEDLVKSYSELEKKLSTGGTPADTTIVTESTPADKPADNTPVDKSAETQPAPTAIDINKFSEEFATKGSLSDDSYTALAKSGISKDIVDSYIAGQKAMQDSMMTAGYNLVGGQDKYNSMIAWAGSNLTDGEKSAFNDAVISSNRDAAALAIKGLEAKYIAVNGRQPAALLSGNSASTGGSAGGFESSAQVTAAIQDPRYKTDSAYRTSVERRMAMTSNSVFR